MGRWPKITVKDYKEKRQQPIDNDTCRQKIRKQKRKRKRNK